MSKSQQYRDALSRGLRDQHGFDVLGGTDESPRLDIPNGIYTVVLGRGDEAFCHKFESRNNVYIPLRKFPFVTTGVIDLL